MERLDQFYVPIFCQKDAGIECCKSTVMHMCRAQLVLALHDVAPGLKTPNL